MKRGLILLCLVTVTLMYCQGEPEPTYEEKPLSEWVAALKDNSESTQKKAAKALIAIGEPSIPKLAKILTKDEEFSLKIRVANILGKMRTTAIKATPEFLKAIENEKSNEKLLNNYKDNLLRINPDPQETLPQILNLIENGTEPQKIVCLEIVEELGSKATVAVKLLINLFNKAIQDNDSLLVFPVLNALSATEIEDEDVIEVFVKCLNMENEWFRIEASYWFQKHKSTSQFAIPTIIKVLNEADVNNPKDMRLIREMANYLELFGPPAKDALPALKNVRKRLQEDYKNIEHPIHKEQLMIKIDFTIKEIEK